MISDSILRELEEIVERGLEDYPVPFKKGNSIRIKNYVVRKNSRGYVVYDCQRNTKVASTNFKSSALAIAKNCAEGKDVVNKALALDNELLKHYNDAKFYKHAIQNSSDTTVKESRRARLEVTLILSKIARQDLDSFIF